MSIHLFELFCRVTIFSSKEKNNTIARYVRLLAEITNLIVLVRFYHEQKVTESSGVVLSLCALGCFWNTWNRIQNIVVMGIFYNRRTSKYAWLASLYIYRYHYLTFWYIKKDILIIKRSHTAVRSPFIAHMFNLIGYKWWTCNQHCRCQMRCGVLWVWEPKIIAHRQRATTVQLDMVLCSSTKDIRTMTR